MRYYDASKNEEGRFIAGVPLRDLDEAEFEALPAHLQRSVDAADFYRKTKIRTEKPERAEKEGDD